MIIVTALDIARRFVGVKEGPGLVNNPLVVAMLQLENPSVTQDSVPWCSAFVNFIAWLLGLPRSKSLMARSWLAVGTSIDLAHAQPGNDVVVLWRDSPTSSIGHVGFFAGQDTDHVRLLAGNQGNAVSIESFPVTQVLGVRRLA